MLFNNYRVIYLINNKSLLKLSSFIRLNKKTIEVGTSIILIIGYSNYMLKGIFNSAYSLAIKDLILKKVAIIKGFYINIILEAYL
jgi:hypothetical protein